jgi:hypothetical protein
MHLACEMKRHCHHDFSVVPTVHCSLFEDNSGAQTLAKTPAMRPGTKHINVKYHNFRSYLADGVIDIKAIWSGDQPAGILTKPLAYPAVTLHRRRIMVWKQNFSSPSIAMAIPETAAMAVASRQAKLGGGQVPSSRDHAHQATLG